MVLAMCIMPTLGQGIPTIQIVPSWNASQRLANNLQIAFIFGLLAKDCYSQPVTMNDNCQCLVYGDVLPMCS